MSTWCCCSIILTVNRLISLINLNIQLKKNSWMKCYVTLVATESPSCQKNLNSQCWKFFSFTTNKQKYEFKNIYIYIYVHTHTHIEKLVCHPRGRTEVSTFYRILKTVLSGSSLWSIYINIWNWLTWLWRWIRPKNCSQQAEIQGSWCISSLRAGRLALDPETS